MNPTETQRLVNSAINIILGSFFLNNDEVHTNEQHKISNRSLTSSEHTEGFKFSVPVKQKETERKKWLREEKMEGQEHQGPPTAAAFHKA